MGYKINQGFITQKIDGKVTVFNGEKSVIHTLNETGAYIFQGLKLGWKDEKIVEGLVKKFGATETQAEEDINEFSSILFEKKIIIKI